MNECLRLSDDESIPLRAFEATPEDRKANDAMISADSGQDGQGPALEVNHGSDGSSDSFAYERENRWRLSRKKRNSIPAGTTDRDIHSSPAPHNEPLPRTERLWSMTFNICFMILSLSMSVLAYLLYLHDLEIRSSGMPVEDQKITIAQGIVWELAAVLAGYSLWRRTRLLLDEDVARKCSEKEEEVHVTPRDCLSQETA